MKSGTGLCTYSCSSVAPCPHRLPSPPPALPGGDSAAGLLIRKSTGSSWHLFSSTSAHLAAAPPLLLESSPFLISVTLHLPSALPPALKRLFWPPTSSSALSHPRNVTVPHDSALKPFLRPLPLHFYKLYQFQRDL